MAEDINNEILISLVKDCPVLWDKTTDEYKDKIATKEAWKLVCCQLREDFEEMGSQDQIVFGKAVMRRWTNLRDAFSKSKRKMEDCMRTGGKMKKYVYSDQMQFLNKLYEFRENADSLLGDGIDDDKEFELPVMKQEGLLEANRGKTQKRTGSRKREIELPVMEQEGLLDANRGNTQKRTGSGKHSQPDDVEMSIALETSTQNSHMCFFQGILPHLKKFDENEILEFQMGVLQVISKINEKKLTTQPP